MLPATNELFVSVRPKKVSTPDPEPPSSAAQIRFPLPSVVITPPFCSPLQSSVPMLTPPPETESPDVNVDVALPPTVIDSSWLIVRVEVPVTSCPAAS
jgi:hypothetical protein